VGSGGCPHLIAPGASWGEVPPASEGCVLTQLGAEPFSQDGVLGGGDPQHGQARAKGESGRFLFRLAMK